MYGDNNSTKSVKLTKTIELSDIDKRVLGMLRNNSKMGMVHIAKKLNIHPNTVINKIKKFESYGIIRRYITDINYGNIGYDIHALILIKHTHFTENTKKISDIAQVSEMYPTSGCYDFILATRATDRRELENTIEEIGNIIPEAEIYTNIIFETIKRYSNFNPFLRFKSDNRKDINLEKQNLSLNKNDLKILAYLRRNGKISLKQIAKNIGTYPSTVAYRISQLEKLGVILKYYPTINFAKIGYDHTLLTLYKIKKDRKREILKKLKNEQDISSVYLITGEYDILSVLRAKTHNEITGFIKWANNLEGVNETYGNLAIDIFKIHSDYNPLEYLIK